MVVSHVGEGVRLLLLAVKVRPSGNFLVTVDGMMFNITAAMGYHFVYRVLPSCGEEEGLSALEVCRNSECFSMGYVSYHALGAKYPRVLSNRWDRSWDT